MPVRKNPKVKSSVLSSSARARSTPPKRPNTLTPSERRRLSKIKYADTRELLEQINYRHQIFNAIEAELEIPELSEQEIVQRVLHLANPHPTFDQKVEAMLNCADSRPLSHGYSLKRDTTWAYAEHPKYAVTHWWDSVMETRAEFRKAIIATINSPKAARRRYSKKIREALGQIVVIPHDVWDGRSGTTELRRFSQNTSAACGYVLMLLLDEERSHGGLLRLCKLEECARPFLGVHAPGGSPPKSYCSDDCTAIAKRIGNAARQAALRKRNAKKVKKRRKKA